MQQWATITWLQHHSDVCFQYPFMVDFIMSISVVIRRKKLKFCNTKTVGTFTKSRIDFVFHNNVYSYNNTCSFCIFIGRELCVIKVHTHG